MFYLLLLPILYYVVVVIYRLYFHPLSAIPGPRLAAATGWYEFCYDVIQGGVLVFELKRLHEKYGPVIRISPREVHVADLGLYHEIFKQNTTFLKDARYYHAMTQPHSLIGIIDPVEHRARRDLVAPFFSKRAMYAIDGLIWEKADKFCQKITEYNGNPIRLQDGFHCLTADIISKYLFGTSIDMLDEPNFNGPHIRNMETLIANLPLCKHFPILRIIAQELPEFLAVRVAPGFATVLRNCSKIVNELIASKSKVSPWPQKDKITPSQSDNGEGSGLVHPTIYDALLDQEGLAARGKRAPNLTELIEESMLLLSAGTDTTSFSLTLAVFYVLSNPEIKTKLLQELTELKERCGGQNMSLKDIEQLPYLTGVAKECLRFSQGLPGKVPRVVPPTGVQVGNIHLPPGTVVGISTYWINHDAGIYPEPFRFWPERWISNPPPDKWFVPFSKGSRACPGINLAYAEIYITLSTLFTKFDLQLYETSSKDMEWKDRGIPFTNGHLKVIATRREN